MQHFFLFPIFLRIEIFSSFPTKLFLYIFRFSSSSEPSDKGEKRIDWKTFLSAQQIIWKNLVNWFISIIGKNKDFSRAKLHLTSSQSLFIKYVNYGFGIFTLLTQKWQQEDDKKGKESLANLSKRLSIVHRVFISSSFPFAASSLSFQVGDWKYRVCQLLSCDT